MKASSNRSTKGFTLIEVMFAAVLMLVGVVGMIDAVTWGSRMLDVARKQTLARQIIQSEIVNLRLNTSNSLPSSGTTTLGSLSMAAGDSNVQALTSGFTCKRTVASVPSMPSSLVQVTFIVEWNGIDGRKYSRSGSSYLSQNGLSLTLQQS
ncbi:MAG: prepilin-type N-terminal cleavage/methylation domain-containing protein [Opitutaceae bacterium]|nr:prepilin-type N-terminal cleavage/methylation domain-containing protein [Opitutaceae bacterium]